MKKIILLIPILFAAGFSSSQNPNTWTQKADFGGGGAISAAVGFSIEGKGYIGTGVGNAGLEKDFWEYDPNADTWTQKADFGGGTRWDAVGFSIESKGYVETGVGNGLEKDFWEYDPIDNTWTQKADFGGGERSGAVGFNIGTMGYVGTGSTQDFWEYDPDTNTWTQKADFGGSVRHDAVGFSIGDKGYLGTGYDYGWSCFNDFWEYNPDNNTWTQKADFSGGDCSGATGFSIGSKGYLGLGWNVEVDGYEGDFAEYDPDANLWTSKAYFGGEERENASGFSIGNKGYIGTGYVNNYEDFWEYSPSCNGVIVFADADNDGFGDASNTFFASDCIVPTGYVSDNTDCNDDPGNGGNSVHPGVCDASNGNSIDDNCDGVIDNGWGTVIFYSDADNDEYGNPNSIIYECTPPAGYVIDSTDCNDDDATINPGAPEVINGIDNNCNGIIDDPWKVLWAKAMGSSGDDGSLDITVDLSGNTYTTGYFSGTADFDPGTGTFNLTSVGFYDIFISKLDNSGNFLWAKAIGGTSYDRGASIALDASGNVYTTGSFYGTVDFDPGAGIFNLTSTGSGSIFISKLDNSGNFVWTKAIGGTGTAHGASVALDASGNVYTTGSFYGTVDFDPGAGIFNLNLPGESDDIFISKLDNAGNFIWAKAMGGTNYDFGHSIVLDASGNIYTTGAFYYTADFDPGVGVFNLTPAGGFQFPDVFISKLDPAGNFMWAKQVGGMYNDFGLSMAIDPASGDIYTTGFFQVTSDFDPGAGTFNLTAAGTEDIFILKLDDSGNFVWAKSMGGGYSTEGYSIALDPANGDVYTTGYFYETADFDPDPSESFYLTSVGSPDIFISKLDASGNFIWAQAVGGIYSDNGRSLAIDGSGNVHITGAFGPPSITFGSTTLINVDSAGASGDIFIAKIAGKLICPAPANLSVTTVTSSSARLNWDEAGDAKGYKVRYKIAGTPGWIKIHSIDNDKTLHGLAASTEYAWQVKSICGVLPIVASGWSEKQFFITDALRLEAISETTIEVYPNPVSQSAIVSFFLNEGSLVTIDIMDVNGRSLKLIADENFSEGHHEVTFNRESLIAGIYLLQLKTKEGVMMKKMVVE